MWILISDDLRAIECVLGRGDGVGLAPEAIDATPSSRRRRRERETLVKTSIVLKASLVMPVASYVFQFQTPIMNSLKSNWPLPSMSKIPKTLSENLVAGKPSHLWNSLTPTSPLLSSSISMNAEKTSNPLSYVKPRICKVSPKSRQITLS